MAKLRTWSDLMLIAAVTKSLTQTEVLQHLGLRPAGGNFASVKTHILRLGLNTDHFNPISRQVLNLFSRRDPTTVFTTNSSVTGKQLRKHMLSEPAFTYSCELCGNIGLHLNRSLTLQIDHRNGIHTDNRKENLRFLCPNCHTQTETFAGRNAKRQKPKKFGRSSPRLWQRKVDHALVYSAFERTKNASQVARDFNISSSAVHKIVKRRLRALESNQD
jgi:hypothetical protein